MTCGGIGHVGGGEDGGQGSRRPQVKVGEQNQVRVASMNAIAWVTVVHCSLSDSAP